MKCSAKNCGKSRVVFSEMKPSEVEIERCVQTIEESSYVCGDRVDVLRRFSVNEKIHCSHDIKTTYYSGLIRKFSPQ